MAQRTLRRSIVLLVSLFASCGGGSSSSSGGGGGGGGGGGQNDGSAVTANPVMFVTQVPVRDVFRTITSAFGSHETLPSKVPRGGDLWIRYPDKTLKNLTRAAGYGIDGLQAGPNAIAVRDPMVHWNGAKAVFSMVVGAPNQNQGTVFFWQLYEITGLGKNDTPVITKVPNQPASYNNMGPCYGSDGRILFTSDRPRDGSAHLYPQLDEYEEVPTLTGIWSLDPGSGDLFLVQHSPSGSFEPIVDSFGRVVYERWDHLERDQQKDLEQISAFLGGTEAYGVFNYTDESAGAVSTGNAEEVFPEPRAPWVYFVNNNPGFSGDFNGYESNMVGNGFNLFFPWTVNQDGTREETLNHVGRHELRGFVDRSINDDPNVVGQGTAPAQVANRQFIQNVMQLREDPLQPGDYLAVDAPEFYTHTAGQVLRIHGAPSMNPNQMTVGFVTPRETHDGTPPNQSPSSSHTGLYRNPVPLADGQIVVSHTFETHRQNPFDASEGVIHDFRLRIMEPDGVYMGPGPSLTTGIVKDVTYWTPTQLASWSGPLFELDPVEVVAKPVPPKPTGTLDAPEAAILADEGVDLDDLQDWLRSQDLALVVSRNVTSRDRNDKQQPYNLHVAGGGAQTTGAGGTVYDVAFMQFFQGDQIRGIGLVPGATQPLPGRRVLAQEMHDTSATNWNPVTAGGTGAVEIGPDGSMAALVPARRALSWQLEDAGGHAVVRERFWVTFQPGEVRTCASCHGVNETAQDGGAPPVNEPQALRWLLQHLRGQGAPF